MLFFIFNADIKPGFNVHFNTSYVIFYRRYGEAAYQISYISIHPMLFFISTQFYSAEQNRNFNTSYVIFYLASPLLRLSCNTDFNTSYVIFYPAIASHFIKSFSISIHPMLFFIKGMEIKSYRVVNISIHPMLFFISFFFFFASLFSLFQYILCYFLSFFIVLYRLIVFDFNTSYVIFYHIS